MSSGIASLPIIRTERCDLAPLGHGDADAMLAFERLVAFDRSATPPPLDDAFYRTRMVHWLADADPCRPCGMWKIVIDRQIIGRIALDQPVVSDCPLLSYAVVPAMHGRGYASEAVVALLAWAFRNCKVTAIMAIIRPTNIGSIGVACRAGMTFHPQTDEHNLVFVQYGSER